MMRKVLLFVLVGVMSLVVAAPVMADAPAYVPTIYADGKAWGTKVVGELPAPKKNVKSFDKLFIITNGVDGQMPVGEAAPGNPAYNGGRWYTHTVTWIKGEPELVKSYAQLAELEDAGLLTIMPGSPSPNVPPFFGCPLLPVK